MTKLLTAADVAQILNLNPARVYELTREKKLPHILVGDRQYRYSEKKISDWAENGGNQEQPKTMAEHN